MVESILFSFIYTALNRDYLIYYFLVYIGSCILNVLIFCIFLYFVSFSERKKNLRKSWGLDLCAMELSCLHERIASLIYISHNICRLCIARDPTPGFLP